MKRISTRDECYQAIVDALDQIKAAQAAKDRAGLSRVVIDALGEARAALDVAAQDIEIQRITGTK